VDVRFFALTLQCRELSGTTDARFRRTGCECARTGSRGVDGSCGILGRAHGDDGHCALPRGQGRRHVDSDVFKRERALSTKKRGAKTSPNFDRGRGTRIFYTRKRAKCTPRTCCVGLRWFATDTRRQLRWLLRGDDNNERVLHIPTQRRRRSRSHSSKINRKEP